MLSEEPNLSQACHVDRGKSQLDCPVYKVLYFTHVPLNGHRNHGFNPKTFYANQRCVNTPLSRSSRQLSFSSANLVMKKLVETQGAKKEKSEALKRQNNDSKMIFSQAI
ncbi:hypothetical protein PanWU01x14_324140 [Parasponia andersonii]|uniref:Uncharacterized protein n=1 Tax=Parasponia andersonii TaxID=3476 RepID=A0A2P5AK84_PARAD|nr:hypothetical protein PanWU01x14_324140 [Parasponia andersonii]